MPDRIQRQRAKGWRMPEGAVYVGRPTRWGNPWIVELAQGVGWICTDTRTGLSVQARGPVHAHDLAVANYRTWIREGDAAGFADAARAALRGRTLCCWCPPHLACHADVLIEVANA